MCGIVGYVELKNTSSCSHYLDQAIETLTHRGPDSYGKEEFFTKQKVGNVLVFQPFPRTLLETHWFSKFSKIFQFFPTFPMSFQLF